MLVPACDPILMVHNARVDLLDFKQTKGLVLRENLACLVAVQIDRKPIRAETKLFSNLLGRKAEGENVGCPVYSFKNKKINKNLKTKHKTILIKVTKPPCLVYQTKKQNAKSSLV